MANAGFVRAQIEVKNLAVNGVKYSELTKIQKAAADSLSRRGAVQFTSIGHGDWLVNKNGT